MCFTPKQQNIDTNPDPQVSSVADTATSAKSATDASVTGIKKKTGRSSLTIDSTQASSTTGTGINLPV